MSKTILMGLALAINLLPTHLQASEELSLDPAEAQQQAQAQAVSQDPLGVLYNETNAAANGRQHAMEALQRQLDASYTGNQRRMKSALAALQALSLTGAQHDVQPASHSPQKRPPLNIVVEGNGLGLPQFAKALLTVEINNPHISSEIRHQDGPQGWQYYTITIPAHLVGFFATKDDGEILLGNANSYLSSQERFPEASDPAYPHPHAHPHMGDLDSQLDPDLHGTLISTYLRNEVVKVYNTATDNDVSADKADKLMQRLSDYLKAVPVLYTERTGEFDFHKRSLETMIDRAAGPLQPRESSQARLLRAFTSDTYDHDLGSIHTQKMQKAQAQLDQLRPILDTLEELSKLLKRVGRLT